MNNVTFGRLLSLGFAVLAIASSLSLTSCRQKTITEVDTVFIHDCTCDTGWTYRQSGTTSGLVISQFAGSSVGTVGGENGTVLRTTDKGTTWIKLSTPNYGTVYGVWFFDANNGLANGDGSSIYKTSDGGMTWNSISFPSSIWQRSLCFTDRMNGFVGTSDPSSAPPGSDGEIWRTSDGGYTWNRVSTNSTGGIYNIQFSSATSGIATGKFGEALYTTDAGYTWVKASTDQPNAHFTHTAFVNATTGFGAASALDPYSSTGSDTTTGYLLHTTDGGRSWSTLMQTNYALQGIGSNSKGVVTAAGWGGNILESTDNGVTWKHSKLGDDRWLDVSYASDARAIMIGSYGHIVTRDR